MWDCVELVHSGHEVRIPGPEVAHGCAADFPDFYTDYTDDYNINFFWDGTIDTVDFASWDESTNELVFKAYDWYFDDKFPNQPVAAYIKIQIYPAWESKVRKAYAPNLAVIFNDQYNSIGTTCNLDISTLIGVT